MATFEGSCDGSLASHLYGFGGTSGRGGEFAREHQGSGPLNALKGLPDRERGLVTLYNDSPDDDIRAAIDKIIEQN